MAKLVYSKQFNSWLDFVTQAEDNPSSIPIGQRESRTHYNTEWNGTNSFEEAIHLAKYGWPEGTTRTKTKLDILYNSLPSKKIIKEMVMSRVGPGTLDMGRYQMGHPECLMTWQDSEITTTTSGEIVPILFNFTASSAVSTEALFMKGATICTLIDLLERTGRRVELDMVLAIRCNSFPPSTARWDIRIKNAQDPLDIDRISFALAHASCLRRIGCSLMEQMPPTLCTKFNVKQFGSYGIPIDVEPSPNTLYIKSQSLLEGYRREYLISWLKEQLIVFGVEVLD